MSTALETIIGLEVHAQMNTRTKMFCGCDNDAWNKEPNTTVCEICMGHPGTLPVPNREAVTKAMRTALALHCTVATTCHFDRKHYFYPDLPMGFQISQYDFPLARSGLVEFDVPSSVASVSSCRIHRLHLENDAGKLTHTGNKTLCDYNRAGTPLMEIVTEPDIRSTAEAVAFAQELRRILIAMNASEADMFKGMMRFDASISLREVGTEKLNPRSEIKNLNSFKALERALAYEAERLEHLWQETGTPLPGNITVGWHDDEGRTRVLREKEEAQDYRYFPEPDIPPLTFDAAEIERVRATLPTLPRAKRQEYVSLGLQVAEAMLLIDQPYYRKIFDAVLALTHDIKRSRSLVLTQLAGFMKTEEKKYERTDATRMIELLSGLIKKTNDGVINKNQEKELLERMISTDLTVDQLIEMIGIQSMADDELIDYVQRAIEENPQIVASYKAGKTQALGAIVGWVMKETKGKADPAKADELLRKNLTS